MVCIFSLDPDCRPVGIDITHWEGMHGQQHVCWSVSGASLICACSYMDMDEERGRNEGLLVSDMNVALVWIGEIWKLR